jgi:hypothetical protein
MAESVDSDDNRRGVKEFCLVLTHRPSKVFGVTEFEVCASGRIENDEAESSVDSFEDDR